MVLVVCSVVFEVATFRSHTMNAHVAPAEHIKALVEATKADLSRTQKVCFVHFEYSYGEAKSARCICLFHGLIELESWGVCGASLQGCPQTS